MTRRIYIQKVAIGGGAPVTVQSMTSTDTADAEATLRQILALHHAGADIVRVAVNTDAAAAALSKITSQSPVPIVADIHFSHKLALAAIENGAAKVRINPGNIGSEEGVRLVADACMRRGIPIRVGVNSGSVHKDILRKYGGVTAEALCESALSHTALLERHGMRDIAVSVKSSDVRLMVEAYRKMAAETDYPLHIGMTHTGTLKTGTVKSAAAIGALLLDGIGDTLRVSLAADPVEEIYAAIEILKAVGLRRGAEVIACPTCGRCKVDLIPIAEEVERRVSHIRTPLKIAVMGCAVNGPGEARECDVGVACGDGEGLILRSGHPPRKVPYDRIVDELVAETLEVIKNRE